VAELTGYDLAATIPEHTVVEFLGYLTADVPELNDIAPSRLLDAWQRWKDRERACLEEASCEGGQEDGEGAES
jgi:hypothetical protein